LTVKTIRYKYKLECGHDAQANLLWYSSRDKNEPAGYHEGDEVKCQPCKYTLKKIVEESKTIEEE
jgi:hypothetical protein